MTLEAVTPLSRTLVMALDVSPGPVAWSGGDVATVNRYGDVDRLAGGVPRKADIPAADHINPHSFRHTFVTKSLAAGVPLQDVQDAAGHRDPRTTRRYERSLRNLDRHPTYVLATHLHRESGNG